MLAWNFNKYFPGSPFSIISFFVGDIESSDCKAVTGHGLYIHFISHIPFATVSGFGLNKYEIVLLYNPGWTGGDVHMRKITIEFWEIIVMIVTNHISSIFFMLYQVYATTRQ